MSAISSITARETRPKIGVYIPGDGTGGPWRYAHALMAGIDLEEFEVVLFNDVQDEYGHRPAIKVARLNDAIAGSQDQRDKKETAPRPHALRKAWHRLTPQCLRLWSGFGQTSRRLAKRLRQNPVDLFHTNNTGCEESAVAAWMAGIARILGTFHVTPGSDLEGLRSGLRYRLLEYLSNHCLDRGIAVSEDTRTAWRRRSLLSAQKVVTIYNGIDPEQFRRRTDQKLARRKLGLPVDDGLVLGGVGRLDPVKGFSYLLEATALLSMAYPRLQVVLAGEGPSRSALEQQVHRLGLAGRVHFTGFLQDVQLVYDALDIFVLPSLSECLSYALLEAMATELPAIGSHVGGIPEVIAPGETGVLVPARNAPALVDALRPLLDSADLRRRMGEAGRERVVKCFQEKDCVRKTIEVYRGLLRSRPQTTMLRDHSNSIHETPVLSS